MAGASVGGILQRLADSNSSNSEAWSLHTVLHILPNLYCCPPTSLHTHDESHLPLPLHLIPRLTLTCSATTAPTGSSRAWRRARGWSPAHRRCRWGGMRGRAVGLGRTGCGNPGGIQRTDVSSLQKPYTHILPMRSPRSSPTARP